MDRTVDFIRRSRRRLLEIYTSPLCRNRKVLLLCVTAFPILYLIWSRLTQSTEPRGIWDDHPAFYLLEYSLDNKLATLRKSADEFNANIQHEPLKPGENKFLPLVGNGLIGVVIKEDSVVNLQRDRVLQLPVMYHPLVWTEFELMSLSAKALDYVNGIAHSMTCYMNDVCITSQYYAHRTLPSIFVQEIEVVNPASYNAKVYLSRQPFHNFKWPGCEVGSMSFTKNEIGARNNSEEFETIVGPVSDEYNEFFVAIIAMKIPTHFYVKPRSRYTWQILTAVCESQRILPPNSNKNEVKTELLSFCKKEMQTALKKEPLRLKEEHTACWQQSWNTGISISYSKAKDALNGDKINATMYYVLSNVRSPQHEEIGGERAVLGLAAARNPHGCYGNIHHTFQASNLWNDLSTFYSVQKSVSFWLITLHRQGCDSLVASGALGVMQAMVLSFGSFRFTSQHLEFNMHPRFLHRDYTFRRLQYGNTSEVNVTVQVGEDNKAIMLVAVEKPDRTYYACDGGCQDGPVILSRVNMQFPVKLTEPVTAILYISPDKEHLLDLHHAIHFEVIGEAPAHEHGVIALHKHGHHLGGLPTFFWVSVCFLIVVFHLFLFKLIYNEYCAGYQDKRSFPDKHRYAKV